MFKLFKNKTGVELNELAKLIENKINSNQTLVHLIDQAGILDGSKIISEFVTQDEYGVAFEHLIYMLTDSGVNLPDSTISRVHRLSKKLKLPSFNPKKPTLIELKSFYNSISTFNKRQKEVVSLLSEIWNVPLPINNTSWIDWRLSHGADNVNFDNGKYKFYAHGYGLAFHSPKFIIDFDFGAEGQHNGFDLYRLWRFLDREINDSIFTSEKHFQKVFDYEKENDKFIYDGYTLYYLKNL